MKYDWSKIALNCAYDAHKNNFVSHRGSYPLAISETKAVLVLYNNHPYSNYPERRDEETELFRTWLGELGIPELAYASYPLAPDEAAGYSYAMILDIDDDHQHDLVSAVLRKYEDIPADWDKLHPETRSPFTNKLDEAIEHAVNGDHEKENIER